MLARLIIARASYNRRVQTLRAFLSAFDRRGFLWKSGAAGAGIILAGSLIAALFYRGRLGEAYDPLNHFVSELGEVGISAAAWAFNGGLLIGGVLLVVFLVGLGRRIGCGLGALFGAVGLACGICGTAVGAVPMNDLLPHIFWARSFFNLGLGTMLFFSLIALLGRAGLPRRLAIPGIVATAAFGAFLAIPQPTASAGGDILGAVMAMLNAPRPAIWTPAVLEWLAVLSVLGWALSVVLSLNQADSGKRSLPAGPGEIASKPGSL